MKILFFLLLFLSQLAVAGDSNCLKLIQSFFEVRISRQAPLEKQNWMSLGEDNYGLTLIGAKEINDYLINLIKNSKNSLELQTFKMYQQDWVDLLISKAREGVSIHIQLSAIDQIDYSAQRREEVLRLIALLRENGVVVNEYDPKVLKRKTEVYSPDMHKKMVVADGKYAYVGNKNLNPHDDTIEFGVALKGKSVNDLRSFFYKDIANSTKDAKYLDEVLKIGSHSNINFLNTHELKNKLINSIHNAQKSITLGQVEFNDADVIKALIEKKRNFPDTNIKIITMDNKKPYSLGPVKFKRTFNIDAIKELQTNGIEVYLIDESKVDLKYFHGKITIFDGEKIIIGSSDYNTRSLIGNAEFDLEIFSTMMASEFENYLKNVMSDQVAQMSFTKTETLIARYFEIITDLLLKLNTIKRTLDKIETSPEFMELFIRRQLGKITQQIISIKKIYSVKFTNNLNEILKSYNKRIILDEIVDDQPLEADEFYTFIGTSSYATMKAMKQNIEKTLNGHFGNGYYFANNIETAIQYSKLRNGQVGTKGAADILIFKVKKIKMNHLILNENNSDDNSALLIEGAEGFGRDYLILKSTDQFKLVRHLQIAI